MWIVCRGVRTALEIALEIGVEMRVGWSEVDCCFNAASVMLA